MKTIRKYIMLALPFLSLIFMYDKCEKVLTIPACTGNCSDVIFSGNALNVAYNTPIGNTQIQVTTPGNSRGSVDTVYVVGNVTTGANGEFSLFKSIDTATHKVYSIKVTVPAGYLTQPETSGEYSTYPNNTEWIYTYPTDSGMQNIQVEAFPATRLKINLHRSSALSKSSFSTDYFVRQGTYQSYPGYSGFEQTSGNTDTSIYIETSPNLYTVIEWHGNVDSNYNYIPGGTDSVVCQPNGTSQVSITY
jgi:hypothetical protein